VHASVVKTHKMTGNGSCLLQQSRGSQLACTRRTRGCLGWLAGCPVCLCGPVHVKGSKPERALKQQAISFRDSITHLVCVQQCLRQPRTRNALQFTSEINESVLSSDCPRKNVVQDQSYCWRAGNRGTYSNTKHARVAC
jgi:hypothetical protein